ncbi:hypothetical protein [Litchfieldia salsa]|uniref:Uncharacterized protein n=1 Tax=Litchfieldia salsa TaxID=930152 RepID=A0A1H0PT41_9BACI|nr:hypothetical protein [Litchfieldia salsa]SDP08317.1 hypothetical protein SAMN05216565_101458 [Litchfieldia salsa]
MGNNIVRILAFVSGLALCLFSILIFIGITIDLSSESLWVNILLYVFVSILPGIGGFFLCKWAIQADKGKRTKYEELENTVFKVAENRGGRLTPIELAMDTDLTLEESKALLEKWALKGYVTIKVSESGALVYEFTGMTTDQEKQAAKGVSEL